MTLGDSRGARERVRTFPPIRYAGALCTCQSRSGSASVPIMADPARRRPSSMVTGRHDARRGHSEAHRGNQRVGGNRATPARLCSGHAHRRSDPLWHARRRGCAARPGPGGRSIDWAMAIVAGLVGSFIGGLLLSLISGDGLAFRPSGIIGLDRGGRHRDPAGAGAEAVWRVDPARLVGVLPDPRVAAVTTGAAPR